MGQFSADIAYTLEVALIAAGLIVLHSSLKQKAKLLKASAWIMMIGGILGLFCTSYWWLRYHKEGVFDLPIDQTIHLMHHDGDALHHFPSVEE